MSHETFVLSSYGITFVTILATILWIIREGKLRRSDLARLKDNTIKPRSEH